MGRRVRVTEGRTLEINCGDTFSIREGAKDLDHEVRQCATIAKKPTHRKKRDEWGTPRLSGPPAHNSQARIRKAMFLSSLSSPLPPELVALSATLRKTLMSKLDAAVRIDLKALSAAYFHDLLICTLIVLAGVALEEFDSIPIGHLRFDLTKGIFVPPYRLIAWKRRITKFGWILIVAGVLGEGIYEYAASTADSIVEEFNDTLLGEAQLEGSLASERAASAYERAALAETDLGEAKRDAAVAEQHSADANAKAESFRRDIAKADESAAQAQSQVAGAMAEAAKANLELAKLKTPRNLSDQQQERIASKIKSFAGTPFDLWVSTDSDSAALMMSIDSVLRSADWKFNPPDGAGLVYANKAGLMTASGVEIHVPAEREAEWKLAVLTFTDALSTEGIITTASADGPDALKTMKRDRIHVMIGSKPLK